MMIVVFSLTDYRFWPRLSFLFFIGTLAAHLFHIGFVAGLASLNVNDVLRGFNAESRMAIFEIFLAASVTVVGKSVLRAKHGPDGYIDSLDISKILKLRFLTALLALPVLTISLLYATSIFTDGFHWQNPDLLGELRDYSIGIIVFIPFGIGTALYMTGGPWLEPRLGPIGRYIVPYVAATLLLNLIFAVTVAGQSTFAIEISYIIMAAIGLIFPNAILIGAFQLLATTSILLQYALWKHADITAYFVIPAISLTTIMLITVRILSQLRMNTLVHQTQRQGEFLNTFVRNGPRYFLVQDQNYKIVEISEAFARDMFGVTADEMIGQDVLDFRIWDPEGAEHIRNIRTKNAQKMSDGDTDSQEYSTKTFDGKLLHLKASFRYIQTPNGEAYRYVVVQDQTDVVNANEKLRQQAYVDGLTGLRNRAAFLEDFSYGGVRREIDYRLFICRIDHLSSINEAYSYRAGDTYLTSLSDMLNRELGDNAAIYRLGGDVFMIAE